MFEDLESVYFSEVWEHNSDVLSSFSRNGKYFVSATISQLVIWDVKNKEITQKFICEQNIDCFGWSPDSSLVYCLTGKKSLLQVWDLDNPYWKYKIDESPLKISYVNFTPDSRHVLVITEFHLKITIWSLTSNCSVVIEHSKAIQDCISFSYCENYLAIAQRQKYEDFISIYTCDTWEVLKSFPVESKNLLGLYFSPRDLVIAVLESYTEEAKVLFYSIDGRLLGKYEKATNFGFVNFAWSPCGRYAAISGCFEDIIIINTASYKEIASYSHLKSIDSPNMIVYRSIQQGDHSSYMEYYETSTNRSMDFLSCLNTSDVNKSKSTKVGTHILKFSSDGQYLASTHDFLPKVLWIYDMRNFRLASLVVHHRKIKDASWHSAKNILAFSCGSEFMSIWTPESCISIVSPFKADFSVSSSAWNPKTDEILLNAKSQSSLVTLANVEEETEKEI